MSLWELLVIAVGLSMDAFAVAVCKGLGLSEMNWKKAAVTGLYFGGFQAVMPLIGFFLGTGFRELITRVDHWIAFLLLGLIGGNMIKEALAKEAPDVCETQPENPFGVRAMVPLSLATSIDALAVGVTFAFLKVAIVPAVLFIGSITFLFGMAGVKIGNVFGLRFKSKAELAGGIILMAMGLKILLMHLGVLP